VEESVSSTADHAEADRATALLMLIREIDLGPN
jgi:hypothetical protein